MGIRWFEDSTLCRAHSVQTEDQVTTLNQLYAFLKKEAGAFPELECAENGEVCLILTYVWTFTYVHIRIILYDPVEDYLHPHYAGCQT